VEGKGEAAGRDEDEC